MVLDKTDSDDKLIDVLKGEIERLKIQMRTQQRAASEAQDVGRGHTIDRKGRTVHQVSTNNDDSELIRLQGEVIRLDRICKTQAEQLSTQDNVIKDLRKSLRPY